MKKLFTLIAMLAGTTAAMATDYTDKLVVTIDGTYTPATDNVISVEEQADGTYNLQLKNFILKFSEENVMPVGTINVPNVKGTKNDASTLLTSNQDILIVDGDLPGIHYWAGKELGPVPVNVNADMKDGHLYALITIGFMGMNIEVTFGDVYQMANSGFEYFHTATSGSNTSDEPDQWHSFMSAAGMLAGVVGMVPHTFISDVVRPGSYGSHSVLVKSGLALGSIVANGTLTNGRLNAGGFTATDTKNNACIDMTITDVDANGDPFYTNFCGKPDSLAVWVKFTQETPQADHPYATVTAAITDGSYYQEPCDKDYTDILVGRAANATIESKDGAWQRLSIPFDYASYTDKEAKTILVTYSTNAAPGQGTGADELYVDDMEMIYNCAATAVTVKGTPIEGFGTAADNTYEVLINGESADVETGDIVVTTDGKGSRVLMDKVDVDCIGGGSDVTITVMSEDLKHSNTYVIKTRNAKLSGISEALVNDGGRAEVKAFYNMNGQMVKSPVKGGVYVVKYTNGKTEKVTLK